MSHSKSLRSYSDVKDIFDKALDHGAVSVNCKNAGQAINMRARLNHFRALDRQSMAEIYPAEDPRHGCSVYDPFVVRLIENTLIIEPRQTDGYTVEPYKPETPAPDATKTP